MAHQLTVMESLFIAASPEEVWKFTQGDLQRLFCDSGGRSHPKIIKNEPFRFVRFDCCGRLSGAWTYEAKEKGTVWSQANTMALKTLFHQMLGPFLRWKFRRGIRRSMRKVKDALEFSEGLSGSLHESFY